MQDMNIGEKTPQINSEKEISIRLSYSGLMKIGIALGIIVILCFGLLSLYNSKKEMEFDTNVRNVISTMLDGAIMAEESGNLIHDVWLNSIFQQADPETNYYTLKENYREKYKISTDIPDYCFNEDFNESLSALFSDFNFQQDLTLIESNKNQVIAMMKELFDVPKGKENAYIAVENLYNQYIGLINCALNPTGSLTTYTETFNTYDSDFVEAYQKAELYR